MPTATFLLKEFVSFDMGYTFPPTLFLAFCFDFVVVNTELVGNVTEINFKSMLFYRYVEFGDFENPNQFDSIINSTKHI